MSRSRPSSNSAAIFFDLARLYYYGCGTVSAEMPKKSAGLLVYREAPNGFGIEVLLVHPGGPFWRNKDEGAWTVPKGEFDDLEDPLEAAQREFKEELGSSPPVGDYLRLNPIKQKNGKTVHAWAVKGDFLPASLISNTFSCEWPPKSQRMQEFPEVDRAEWFAPDEAKRKIIGAQVALIDQLLQLLG
jgi:predicted NUDIX family NTP pyrophosphohydrolase